MKLVRDLDQLSADLQHGAVAIGNFDGVHRGHARIAKRLIDHARRVDGPAIVFTFEPHPVLLLRPELAPPPLTWIERKAELLDQLGIDLVIAYHTDAELLSLSPDEFFSRIVVDRLGAKAMVEGPNFFFGRDRTGDIQVLDGLCRQHHIQLEVVQPVRDGDEYISSSRVRKLIGEGDLGQASRMLTQPYRIRGMVTHGAGRGAGIGFPTANVAAIDTLLPGEGVYGGRAYTETESWPAAINVGPNPTFGEQGSKVEVHLIGFDGTLYGKALEVDFLQRLRDIQAFDSVDHLRRQLESDVRQAAELVIEARGPG